MWVMKLSVPYKETALLGNLAKKYKISIIGYPISHEIKSDGVYVITSGLFLGEKSKLKHFYREMLKDKRTLKLEIQDNFGIAYMKQHLSNQYL